MLPTPSRRGRPRTAELREIVKALRDLVRSGCGGEMPPIHFGPRATIRRGFHRQMRRFYS